MKFGFVIVLGFVMAMLPQSVIAGVIDETVSPPKSAFMKLHGVTDAPLGFVDLCARERQFCKAVPGQGKRRILDAQAWQDLVEVNLIVNRTVAPRADQELYGTLEWWTLPKRAGDCEDYGLLKRQMLIERGWDPGTLLMTVVRDEAGQGHAVLTVSTKSGDYILDNRQDVIGSWTTSRYAFVKRQSTLDPATWMALGPNSRPSPALSASRDPAGGFQRPMR